MKRISIAHDYLLQHGGAERVVSTWADMLPESSISCIAYDADQTFEVFRRRNINAVVRDKRISRRIEYLLPLLPRLSSSVSVPRADVSLVSTSGWAHEFRFQNPTVAYVHSPARWLHAPDDYSQKLSRIKRLGLRASRRHLLRADLEGMRRMSMVIVNSRVSQRRVKEAYNIDAPIIHPPVRAVSLEASAPEGEVPGEFALVVSRSRGYKNTALATEAAVAAGMPCVVVGTGSEALSDEETRVVGLGRVEDSELRWLYQRARVLIGSAHEDFGLTVLEANLEGTPAAAIPHGGYLETVREGVNGSLAPDDSVDGLVEAIQGALRTPRESAQAWAATFSPSRHLAALLEAAEQVRS